MGIMVGIDTGGTFTDGFFTRNGELKTVKVLTTPHDLTVCLADCLREGARQFGISLQDMLADTDIVRYSTTVSVNTIIQKAGVKIGLIVSHGFKDTLYASDAREAAPVLSFVPAELIVEVVEETDNRGNIVKPLDKADVVSKMQYLADMGIRAIVVSLNNSNINSAHEDRVKAIIKEQSPSFFLGSMRVLLSSDISDHPSAFCRTNAAVLNGYIHDVMVRYLYRAEDDLRANLYKRPLMVGHSHGGVARVAKTRAIDTFSSGPIAGVAGAALVAKMHGFSNAISVDVGGTSLDIGIVHDGVFDYSLTPVISGLPVSVPMLVTHSAGQGGCSIVRITDSGNIQIGPRSAGASPGPACFDRGGIEVTTTDADVVLGYIDPDYFLGGKMKLNKEKAVSAIKRRVADRLGIRLEEAAYRIKETMDRNIQNEIVQFLKEKGVELARLTDFALVAFGGAGPTHLSGLVKGVKFGKVLTSPYASTFCAFGFSILDLVHRYAKYLRINLFDGKNYLDEYGEINQILRQLLDTARRDIKGEGFSPEEAFYYLEFIGDESLGEHRVRFDGMQLTSEREVINICAQFEKVNKPSTRKLTTAAIILNAAVPMPHFEMKDVLLAGEDATAALKGTRDIFWSPETGYIKTPIYDRQLMSAGNKVIGPAVIQSKDTTYVIPAGMSFSISEYSHGVLEEV